MSKNINTRIALKRDTRANWDQYNPVLLNGELIFADTDNGLRAKVGDGTKTYTQLPFTDEILRTLINNVDRSKSSVFVTKNGEERLLNTFNIIKLTQEEYEELEASGSLDPDALYLTEGDSENTAGSKVVMTQDGVEKELPIFNIVKLSEEEYRQLIDSNTLDPDTLYLTEGNKDFTANMSIEGISEEINELEIIKLTEAEYKTIIDSGNYNSNILYSITDPHNIAKNYLPLNGGTMTGALKLYNSPAQDMEAANKLYVDNINTSLLNKFNDYLPLAGGEVTGEVKISSDTPAISMETGALTITGGVGITGDIYANKVWGAVWNDYAECRESDEVIEAGRVVKENGDDTISLADGRLIYGCSIITDTFGFMIGKTDKAKTPIAVSGRVLAYPYEGREVFRKNIGSFVCSGPGGTVSLMDKEEIWKHPEAIIGQVSAVPDYDYWGSNDAVKVDGRVWIKVV